MACSICLDSDCKREQLEYFHMFLISANAWFPEKAIIPCKARAYFNNLVGDKFEMVSWRGPTYTISVEKKRYKTVLKRVWSSFVNDHILNEGDKILMLYEPTMKMFRCMPHDIDGVEKLPEMDPEERTLSACLYTSNENDLLSHEKTRLLEMMDAIPQPHLRAMVHRLTSTNVNQFQLKLPKSVAEMIHLSRS